MTAIPAKAARYISTPIASRPVMKYSESSPPPGGSGSNQYSQATPECGRCIDGITTKWGDRTVDIVVSEDRLSCYLLILAGVAPYDAETQAGAESAPSASHV
ncbi:hypothetical protein GCM10020219_054140 [Nonomuraea dietziae]